MPVLHTFITGLPKHGLTNNKEKPGKMDDSEMKLKKGAEKLDAYKNRKIGKFTNLDIKI